MSTNLFSHPIAPLAPLAPLALLTDFGTTDGYVAVMKGVILGRAPGVSLIDITHDIRPQDISSAAWVLATSYRYFPARTIFVCVVDPGVGSQRLPVAFHAGEWFFVGPNNGLFSYILQEQTVYEAVALTNPAHHLTEVSATFQGRDIFSPVAASIVNAVPLTDLGVALRSSDLQRLDIVPPLVQNEQVSAQIVHVDHFGNLVTNIPIELLPDFFNYPVVQLQFVSTGTRISARRRFFADSPGKPEDNQQPFLYVDSSGYIGVALQNGNIANVLHMTVGQRVILTYSQ
jgi:S-adenosylmethionine hydrolase